jgi:1,4-dihydroxy-2-naphthoate polyprenyltransferase
VPVSAWAAAILVINEVPDIAADRRAAKRTLVVRWGVRGARWIYGSLVVMALAASVAAIVHRALPGWYAWPAMALAGLGLHAARGITAEPTRRAQLRRSIELTLALHALGGVSLVTAILLNHAKV